MYSFCFVKGIIFVRDDERPARKRKGYFDETCTTSMTLGQSKKALSSIGERMVEVKDDPLALYVGKSRIDGFVIGDFAFQLCSCSPCTSGQFLSVYFLRHFWIDAAWASTRATVAMFSPTWLSNQP